jgi:hypothetical protein
MANIFCNDCEVFVKPVHKRDGHNACVGLPVEWDECPVCEDGELQEIEFLTCGNCKSSFNLIFVEIYTQDGVYAYCPVCDMEVTKCE